MQWNVDDTDYADLHCFLSVCIRIIRVTSPAFDGSVFYKRYF